MRTCFEQKTYYKERASTVAPYFSSPGVFIITWPRYQKSIARPERQRLADAVSVSKALFPLGAFGAGFQRPLVWRLECSVPARDIC